VQDKEDGNAIQINGLSINQAHPLSMPTSSTNFTTKHKNVEKLIS